MIIKTDIELEGMQRAGKAVAGTLKGMREFARVGMTTKELDDYGRMLLDGYGAKSAPFFTYGFPGATCISINNEMAHGIPSARRFLQEGDVVNIDVSASLDGFCSDNGASFVLGEDIHAVGKLVETSMEALYSAIGVIRSGVKISEVGRVIERVAKREGFTVIRNLGGHGIGKSLHESPDCILNYYDRYDNRRFKKNMVVAVETFLTTGSSYVNTEPDKWTLTANKGGYCAQHEHTLVVTEDEPLVLTDMNEIVKK
ncbi:MAG: type I methionyl aminopeptidase [Tannerellaceae bacterium]|nr:type I methionyl aminopeptidase [Tannerellaceae bacterium]